MTSPNSQTALALFLKLHWERCSKNEEERHIRLGQRFCNMYIKEPWPALYHESSLSRATALILVWLERHQYTDSLPEPFHE